jgi:catechol 2,3-dioxygenase-like lactoylglutathione lyase family enzyme
MRFQFVFEAKDYDAAIRFYGEGLGLPIEHAWDRGADRGSIFLAADGFIEVVSDSMGLRGPHGIGVAIQTEDVESPIPGRREFRSRRGARTRGPSVGDPRVLRAGPRRIRDHVLPGATGREPGASVRAR